MRAAALALIFILCLAPCATAQAEGAASVVDLSRIDVYVREGFALEWTFQAPLPNDSAWKRVKAVAGKRTLAVRELGLPETPGPTLFPAPGRKPAERYCVIVPFTASSALLSATSGVGLYLPEIGQNWQAYLNGYLIRDETYFDETGRIRVQRSVRGGLIQLDARWLREGMNTLAFMVAGNPADPLTGLGSRGSYLIGPYDRLAELRSETPRLMLVGIYFFFALYHWVLYGLRPKEKSYLFYGVATVILAFYIFARTYVVFDVLLDTNLIRGMDAAFSFVLIPVFMAFFNAVLRRKPSVFEYVYGAACAALAILQFALWREFFTLVWKWTLPLPIAYLAVFDIILPLARSIRHYVGLAGKKKRFQAVLRALAKSDATKLLLGGALVGGTALLDSLGVRFVSFMNYMDLGFLVLVFGTGAVLAGQFIRVYQGVDRTRQDLERRVETRTRELETTLAEEEALSVRLSDTSAKLKTAADIAGKDLQIATQVQQGFFPKKAPVTGAWEAAFAFLPAGGISGDFYDFYQSGERLEGLVVGDVSGHGIASGLITVLARSVFHRNFYERKHRSLGAVLEAINAELIPELSAVENFITAAVLRLDESGQVEYASAAHTEILYRGVGRPRALALKPQGGAEYKGPPLGREGIEAPYKSVRFSLKQGDSILLYTDGLDESRNVDGEPFGIEGVLASYSTAPQGEAAQMLDYVMQEWRFHTSGAKVADDTTVVLLKKL
ncbi:MAG: SpoIIE family protein phosphatase [Spirochaetales bacterium]|nr:SpoIIE family protein phosphatase [Spirochaetales bacterium]